MTDRRKFLNYIIKNISGIKKIRTNKNFKKMFKKYKYIKKEHINKMKRKKYIINGLNLDQSF